MLVILTAIILNLVGDFMVVILVKTINERVTQVQVCVIFIAYCRLAYASTCDTASAFSGT